MWALLDYDGKTVVAAIPPSVRLEDVADEIDGRIVVEMTTENSPAGIGWTWDGTKFYNTNL